MTEERISPLRQRMIEDMRIRGMGDKAPKEVSMTEERISPLRQRMIEDMRIRGMGDKAPKMVWLPPFPERHQSAKMGGS